MNKKGLLLLIVAFIFNWIALSAQIQTGVFRTPAGNIDYHQFSRNNQYGPAVYINQEATNGSILRLLGGTADLNQTAKFSFESNGNLAMGPVYPTEKLTMYNPDTVPVFTQYGNASFYFAIGRGFVTGISGSGAGMVWHRENQPISFGTSGWERMRINADGTTDFFGFLYSRGYRTAAGNESYHQFTANNPTGAVFINQEGTWGPILRLSSGTADIYQNVKFSFENNGNLGIGTTTVPERLSLYNSDALPVYTWYGNPKINMYGGGFVTGIDGNGTGMVWQREALPLSFGTANMERMRIDADGTINFLGPVRSLSGGFQNDPNGIFYSKGYRTIAGNTNYHHFTSKDIYQSAVYINQETETAPILRLSSGTAVANDKVKFSFENNGNLTMGSDYAPEKLTLYRSDTLQVFTQYVNGQFYFDAYNRGFVTGVSSSGAGMVWHRENKPISFGTLNMERMRINADGTTDFFGFLYSRGYRTAAGNENYHQLTANNTTGAVFINQVAETGPILRLSSGTADVNQNVKFSFENNGNLGIGTTNPAEKLSLYTAGNVRVATQYGNGTGSGFAVGVESDGRGSVWHVAGYPITLGTSNLERMRINADGNVGIGTVSPDYKLDVVGTVRAHSVQVSTAKTADFVFDDDYRLQPLPEVESFIAANKHLPEIAPAAEMKEKGIDMADMQIKLLQKVEELTLYVIQQQKEIEELKRLLQEKK